MAINLTEQFTDKALTEKTKAAQWHAQNEAMGAQMGNLDTTQVTTALGRNAATNAAINNQGAKKGKEAMDDAMYLALLDSIRIQITQLEDSLEASYGEHFAEDLLADLTEKGLFNEEEQKAIMSITDQSERRQAIAAAIQEKLDQGAITQADLEDVPAEIKQWLALRNQEQELMQKQGIEVAQGLESLEAAPTDAKDVAKDHLGNDIARKDEMREAASADKSNEQQDNGAQLNSFSNLLPT